MSALSQALFSAQSTDSSQRTASLKILQDLSHSNPVGYLLDLSIELSNSASPGKVRQLAGILIKNLVQNSTHDALLENVWQRVDPAMKTQVRNSTLGSLASEEKEVRLIASQTVAALACIDIPQGQWTEVLTILITNATNLNKTFKVSALRTLGYICEGLPTGAVGKSEADRILTSLATNLDVSEADIEVKKVALDSLRNSLKFISANIANDSERSIIFALIYSCCSDNSLEIRKQSMMILCDIANLYYDFIASNLIELGALTYNIIKSPDVDVGIYAIEFWNQIADEEVSRLTYNEKPCSNYISTAAQTLVPLLLEKIHFFDQDQDEWNLHKACASTLASISFIVRDAILPLVGDYIAQHIKDPNFKYRSSAAVIIGCIVEGVQNAKLLIQVTFASLLEMLSDPSAKVRETAAWSISKVSEFHYKELVDSAFFATTFGEIIKTLKDLPIIASHGCWTIMSLFKKEAVSQLLDREKVVCILESVIQASLRPDASESGHDLLLAIYTAMNEIVEEMPDEMFQVVVDKIEFLLGLLERSLTDASQVAAQGHICNVLQTAFGRADAGSISEVFADKYVGVIITIFKHRNTVVEEGLQGLGTLADNVGIRFAKYMDSVVPFVEWCVESSSASLCKSGVITCGDFSRALQMEFGKAIPRLLPKLLLILSSEQQMFDVKIRVIDTLSDFATHNTKAMTPFLTDIFKYIESASMLSLDLSLGQANPDMLELMTQLRESIVGFYTGLIQGIGELNEEELIFGYMPRLLEYAIAIVQPHYKPTNTVHMSCIGIIGDMAASFGTKVSSFIRAQNVTNYLLQAEMIEDKNVKEILLYTKDRLKFI